MKVVFSFVFILFFAPFAKGQQKAPLPRVEVITFIMIVVEQIEVKKQYNDGELTRLYRRPNTRVKKALNFYTVKDRPQMA